MYTKEDLRNLLRRINHRAYPAYKDTRGSWQFDDYALSIDHVQGDPYAAPSSLSLVVPGRKAGFPASYYQETHRRTALEDHLLRLFSKMISHGAGTGRRGAYDAQGNDYRTDGEDPNGRRSEDSSYNRRGDEEPHVRHGGEPQGAGHSGGTAFRSQRSSG